MLGRPRGRDANRSRLGHFEEAGHDPINQPYLDRSVVSLILSFVPADAQQKSQKGAPNPYLKGTEGYDQGPRGLTSYQPVAIDQPFAAIMAHDVAAKPGIEREHQALLDARYDLGDHPAADVMMEHGKPLQEGVRVKLPQGVT